MSNGEHMTSTPEDAELLKLCEKPLHEMNSHHVLTVQSALKSRLLSPAITPERLNGIYATQARRKAAAKGEPSNYPLWFDKDIAELLSALTASQATERRQRDPGCATCAGLAPGALAPPHDASPRCESGKRPNCSCDICF